VLLCNDFIKCPSLKLSVLLNLEIKSVMLGYVLRATNQKNIHYCDVNPHLLAVLTIRITLFLSCSKLKSLPSMSFMVKV